MASQGGASLGAPLGTKALDQVVLLTSYVPTIFGILALATATLKTDDAEFEDKHGVVGGLCGLILMGYSIFFCIGLSARSGDICKVLMVCRMGLGIIFVIGGTLLALKQDLPRAIVMFCFAAFALPEAYLLFIYAGALTRDVIKEEGAQLVALQSHRGEAQPPPSWAAPVSGPSGSFGIGPAPPGVGFGPPPLQPQWAYH